jgi:hypothetical protein
MNSVTKYNFELALYNRKLTPNTLERIRTVIFSGETNYIRNNEINETHIGDIPIEILIHILSFVMYAKEVIKILNDDTHSMLITQGNKLYGIITHNSGTPTCYECGNYYGMSMQRINGWKEMPWGDSLWKKVRRNGCWCHLYCGKEYTMILKQGTLFAIDYND